MPAIGCASGEKSSARSCEKNKGTDFCAISHWERIPKPYRSPVSDPKTERLINLTMALLASKRLITKGEIFQSVAGYSGSVESMERMFERDKDDLRSLGIEIEVGPLDIFFEDELGYRIAPDQYSLQVPSLTPAELGVLSVAANAWQNSLFSESAQRALRKLESLGIETSTDSLRTSILPVDQNVDDFPTLWDAVLERRSLTFLYTSTQTTEREVNPYKISLFKGEWYLVGEDCQKSKVRTFKVRRMSQLKTKGRKGSFQRPAGFNPNAILFENSDDTSIAVKMKVKIGRALALRASSIVNPLDEEWDLLTKNYRYDREAIAEILWYGPDVVVLEPQSLRSNIVSILEGRI